MASARPSSLTHNQLFYETDSSTILYRHTGTDLDTIRACFSEKEKELSIAVAKVEALTRQLEELRRGRRGFGLTAPQDGGGNQQPPHTTVTRELEKLRRELMVSSEKKKSKMCVVNVEICVCFGLSVSGSITIRMTYFHANYNTFSTPTSNNVLLHICSSRLTLLYVCSIAINFHYSRMHACTFNVKRCSNDKPSYARSIKGLSSCKSACRSERQRTFCNKRI